MFEAKNSGLETSLFSRSAERTGGNVDFRMRAKSLPLQPPKPSKRRDRNRKGRPRCANGLCSRHLGPFEAAHECEHGVACRYHQDDTGRVVSWVAAECLECRARKARNGAAA
jgi:hypothetical protein